MTIEELKGKMQEAVKVFQDTGDMSGIQAVSKEMDRAKSELAKQEAVRLQKEAETLAGAREELAIKIHDAVKELKLDKELKAVKAWGFAYKVDKANPDELDIIYKSVNLTTRQVKKAKAGTGGAARGKSKDEYGISLGEIFNRFATDEDKKRYAAAASNSGQWQVKVAVKKRALDAGLLQPIK